MACSCARSSCPSSCWRTTRCTRRDLSARFELSGIASPENAIWTPRSRRPISCRPAAAPLGVRDRRSGAADGAPSSRYTLTERNPDYVVLGGTRTYSFERISQAIRLVAAGARFIATNPDPTGPSPDGPLPATGSVAALISRATGKEPYYVGKPNPLMMRSALNAIDAHSETTA